MHWILQLPNVTAGTILHHKTWERYESAFLFHYGEVVWQVRY